MKEKFKKSTALLQVFVMLISSVILLFSVGTNESVAYINNKAELDTGLRFIELYTEKQMRDQNALTVQKINNKNVKIKADLGTVLYLKAKAEVKLEDSQLKITPRIRLKDCTIYYQDPSSGKRQTYKATESEFKFDKAGYYLICVHYHDKFGYNYTTNIDIQVSKNEIIPKHNAVKIGGVIYAKEGNTATLGTSLDNTKAERRGTFSTSSGYESSGTFGEKIFSNFNAGQGTIVWSNSLGGRTTNLIRSSNLSTGEYRINGLNNAKISSVNESYNGGRITRRIGVKFGEKTAMQVMPVSVSPSVTASNCIENIAVIKTASGRKGGMRQFKNGEASAVYDNIFQEPCVLKVVIRDYKGNEHTEYWDIIESDNTAVKNNDTTPVNTKDYSDDKGGGSTPGYTPVESYSPGIEVSWEATEWYDKEMLYIDVKTTNSEDTAWTLVKRTNVNVASKTKGATYTTYGLDNGRIAINTQDKEEGLYDVILYTSEDTSGYGHFNIIATEYMGGKYTVHQPSVTLKEKGQPDELTGEVTYTYTMENCTAYKYKIIKRDDPNQSFDYDKLKNTGYDSFDGKEVLLDEYGTKTDVPITIKPLETGSGTYDIVVYVINRAANDGQRNIYYPIVSDKIEANVNPTISFNYEKNSMSNKQVKISTKAFAGAEITERYYKIYKTERYSNAKCTAEDIKAENKTFKDGDVIELDYDELGAGWYKIACYVKDSEGREKISTITQDISKGTDIKFEIEGEQEGSTSALYPRYVQNVNITATSETNDKVRLSYFTSTENLADKETGKIGAEIFNDSKYEIKTVDVENGESITATIKAIEGEEGKNVYLYVMANPIGPNYSNATILRTGSIRIDGTPLKLTSMYVENNGTISEKKSYGLGQKLTIVAEFNHDIAKSGYLKPYLIAKVNGKTLILNPEKIEGNKIKFTKVIDEECENGTITIEKLDMNDPIPGKDAKEYTFDGDLSKITWYDFVSKLNYTIDTKIPEIESYEIQINADESKIISDDENNVKYIKDIKDAKLVINYSEEISGKLTMVMLNKGDKEAFNVTADKLTDNEERIKDEYDLTEQLNSEELKKFEGEVALNSIWEIGQSVKDDAGNLLGEIPEKAELRENTTYILNGEKLENTKLVLDSSVYEPEVYVGSTRITENGKYNVGTTFKVFAEFNSEENCKDASGLKENIIFNIYRKEENEVVISDKDGNELVNTQENTYFETENSNNPSYDKVDKYILKAEQLPITFSLEDEGKYFIEAEKEDNLGNKASKELELDISQSLSIDRENSGLLNINDNEMHCINNLNEDQKIYTVTIHAEDPDFEFENVKVYTYDAKRNKVEAEFAGSEATENGVDAKYEFTIYKSGKYAIDVEKEEEVDGNIETSNLLKDSIEFDNVYMIGDLDQDGIITSLDAVFITQMLVTEVTKHGAYAGNVTNHTERTAQGWPRIDISDAVTLAKYYTGDVYIRDREEE